MIEKWSGEDRMRRGGEGEVEEREGRRRDSEVIKERKEGNQYTLYYTLPD